MTKEECIALLNRYSEYNGVGIPNLAGCREAMRTAAELLQRPALPSNLDEAAEKLASDIAPDYPDISWDTCFEKIKAGIKAGAEWMAGQGESHETEIVSRVTGNGLLPAVTCLVNKSYKEGDKVVVQIRKK